MKKISASIAIALSLLLFVIFTGYRSAAVQSEFKKHISIYPGAMVISSEKLPIGNNVVLDINDTTNEIHKFYINELTDNGWSALSIRNNFMAFEKGDKGIMIDVVKVLNKKSRVTISYLKNV